MFRTLIAAVTTSIVALTSVTAFAQCYESDPICIQRTGEYCYIGRRGQEVCQQYTYNDCTSTQICDMGGGGLGTLNDCAAECMAEYQGYPQFLAACYASCGSSL